MTFSINIAAVLVAGLAAFAVGFLWHGPLFGKQWLKLKEIPQSEVDAMRVKGMGPMAPHMIAAYIQQVVVAGVIAHLSLALGLNGAGAAVLFAVLLWVGFYVTALLNGVLWERKKPGLYFFEIAYHLVSIIVVTLIVVLWR